MDIPMPQEEHRWLLRLVGEWTVDGEGTMGPDQPMVTWQGAERVRAVGDLWIVAEAQGASPGEAAMTNIMTLGYDPQRQGFVGAFISSAAPVLWVYDGALDAAKRVLTLTSEGPSMVTEGARAPYRDVIEILSDDHRTLTSFALGDDGHWHSFMTAHYRRVT